MVGKDNDDVGCLNAELQTETSTADFDEQRRSPTPIGISFGDQTLAVAAANTESAFDDVRYNGYSDCFFQQRFRYFLIGSPHDRAQDRRSIFGSRGFVGRFGRSG